MGCFLGCFGGTKKKKRPKGGTKNASSSSGAHSYGRYVPLDSDASLKLDYDEKQKEGSADLIRDKPKESAAAKIKKTVSFNLNLRTYEPIPNEESSSCYNEEDTGASSLKYLNYEDDGLLSSKHGSSFPANHRYANCTYDDEDEIEFEDIDLEDEEDEDEDDEELDFDEEGFVEEEFDSDYARMRQVVEGIYRVGLNQDVVKAEPSQNARKRSEYASSVLNPVQNLTKWKEVKASSKQQMKLQKENMVQQEEKPPSQIKKSDSLPGPEVTVDSSLSTWLVSSRSC